MLLVVAALLFQFPVFAQPATPVVSIARSETPKDQRIAHVSAESEAAAPEALASGAEAEIAIALVPGRLIPEPVAGAVPSPSALAAPPTAATPIVPVYSARTRIHPDQRTRRIWLGLSIAQHSGAAFDAWTTRRALSQGNARELNPMLRPFAGNASLYAVVQVGPTIFDYLSHRMMTSRRGWVRHTWWIPQAMSAAVSITSGVHNLGVYSAR